MEDRVGFKFYREPERGPRRKTWTHSVLHPDRDESSTKLKDVFETGRIATVIRPFGTPTAFLVLFQTII